MTDPVEVLLRFAFIGVLYLFLLWVARSALKDLRAGRGESVRESEAAPAPPPRGILVAEKGAGLGSGTAYEVDGALTIGRSPQTDVQISDPFASARHARVYEQEGVFYVEDMGSTNGTYLNGRRLGTGELLHVADKIRIGDTEFRYEQR
jgi:pSer/pThr/pTyr-binding forkhead associated (FHA) protein